MSETNVSSSTIAKALEAAKLQAQLAEQLCRAKYPHLHIVEGSMVQEEAHPTYGSKRRVKLLCSCGVEVERATSDLHTFIGCNDCKKEVRKANKASKKLTLLEALKAAEAAKTEADASE